jgi:signal transduction histidine kinase
VLGLIGALAVAGGLARLVGRRISGPITALAAAAEAMGRGAPVQSSAPARVREMRLLEQALGAAEEALRERHRLEERERTALRAADRAKDEFLAMLSHELRNPLAALTTAAGVLKAADPGTEAAAYARDVVGRQTQHMARLIEDLLDVSRITMGKVILERETLNLADVAAGIVSDWRSSGRFDRHPVSLEAAPAWVDADRARIEQIIANLLDNALKFTPPGKAISVAVTMEEGCAALKVADAGEGLAPDALGRVFDLFVQGQPGHKGGMGIGLALVKRLAELHGGKVVAASDGIGRGATFTVLLPALRAPA